MPQNKNKSFIQHNEWAMKWSNINVHAQTGDKAQSTSKNVTTQSLLVMASRTIIIVRKTLRRVCYHVRGM